MTHHPSDLVEQSQEQKRIRREKLRVELAEFGYSIVTTKWLQETLDLIAAKPKEGMETANGEAPRV